MSATEDALAEIAAAMADMDQPDGLDDLEAVAAGVPAPEPEPPAPPPIDLATLPRLMPEVDVTRYHSDPFAAPSLSASIAKILVHECPLRAYLAHPKLGGLTRPASQAMKIGTLVHALVFNQAIDLEIVHAENFRKKLHQTRRNRAVAENRTVVLARELEQARAVAEAIVAQALERGIELRRGGLIETPAAWIEETEHGPIVARGIFDWAHVGNAIILDLKTCRSANPTELGRHIIEHGYDIQAAAYKSALRALNPGMAGREAFRWLFIEQLPPGAPSPIILTVAEADGALDELGAAKWRDACEAWAKCLTTNTWPAYTTGIARVAPPAWAIREEFER